MTGIAYKLETWFVYNLRSSCISCDVAEILNSFISVVAYAANARLSILDSPMISSSFRFGFCSCGLKVRLKVIMTACLKSALDKP